MLLRAFPPATAEPGDEEAVTRAKYFIRDEFLVSTLDKLPFKHPLMATFPQRNFVPVPNEFIPIL